MQRSLNNMLYDPRLIAPMRQELVDLGFRELRTAADVDEAIRDTPGTALVVVNSVCGCSARNARPAVRMALEAAPRKPDQLTTVFAGQDIEATERARGYFTGYAPSSPAIALMKDGRIVHMIERRQIEGRQPGEIAADLQAALERHV